MRGIAEEEDLLARVVIEGEPMDMRLPTSAEMAALDPFPSLENLEAQGIESYSGVPDPNWYRKFTYHPGTGVSGAQLVNLQMDFVWAIPFKARPLSSTKPCQ
ncbi:MAG: hypothetical protein ACREWG_08245 [Gammaproteobacteria bacterium]